MITSKGGHKSKQFKIWPHIHPTAFQDLYFFFSFFVDFSLTYLSSSLRTFAIRLLVSLLCPYFCLGFCPQKPGPQSSLPCFLSYLWITPSYHPSFYIHLPLCWGPAHFQITWNRGKHSLPVYLSANKITYNNHRSDWRSYNFWSRHPKPKNEKHLHCTNPYFGAYTHTSPRPPHPLPHTPHDFYLAKISKSPRNLTKSISGPHSVIFSQNLGSGPRFR